jgi:hypothetical protein
MSTWCGCAINHVQIFIPMYESCVMNFRCVVGKRVFANVGDMNKKMGPS